MFGKSSIVAYNAFGRRMELTFDEFEDLKRRGFEFRKVEYKIEEDDIIERIAKKRKKSDKIAIYPQRFTTGEKNCASDRIRCEWIIKNSDKFELYDDNNEYDTIIFHKPIEKISSVKGFKVLDLCDAVWNNIGDFDELIKPIDLIVVSTEGLKEELEKKTDKKIVVIGDGHDFDYYKTKVKNKHENVAKEVVWFGYAQNAKCIEPYIEYLHKLGLKLTAIAQCPLPPIDKADKFIKWDVDTCIEETSKADFALLPKNGKLKSDNKTITAYLSGIPVAKNKKDIFRFIDPKERRKELKSIDLEKYSAKNRAKEYIEAINEAKNDIKIYTAICGEYERPRDDIEVYSRECLFNSPVMNAKIFKVLSHKYIKNKYSVWVDGNIFPLVEPKEIVGLLGDSDIAVFSHPYRSSIYEEHPEAKKRLPVELRPLIDKQIEDYQKEGMPEWKLAECGMIIRKHSEVVEEFNNRWWAEITRYQQRDQISFPYVWWKMRDRIKIKLLDGNVRNHEFFKYEKHKNN